MDKTIKDLVEEKLNSDTAFQDSIKDLTDEEKDSSIETKRSELLDAELKTLQEKASKAEQNETYAKNEKTRAEKAEAELKKLKSDKKEEGDKLSTKDFYALTKANVPEEDVDDVAEYARFKGISVSDALKSSVVKATLAEKAQNRTNASAMQTRTTRSQSTTPDGQAILEKVRIKGEEAIPEGGSDEAKQMFIARSRSKGIKIPDTLR